MAEYYNPGYKSPLQAITEGLGVAANIYGIKEARDTHDLLIKKQKESDEKEAKAKLLDDPNSEESKTTRALYSPYGISVPETMSANQAEKNFGTAGGYQLKNYEASLKPPEDMNKKDLDRRKTEAEIAKITADIAKGKTDSAKTPKFSEGQSNAATFAKRMEQSQQNIEQVLNKVGTDGKPAYDPSGYAAGAQNTSLPWVGNIVPERFKSEDHKLFSNAKGDFISAVLRKESGAAISQSEFDKEDMKYFPQAGDSPAVKDQKAQLRAIAVAGMKSAAGGAYDAIPISVVAKKDKPVDQVPAHDVVMGNAPNRPKLTPEQAKQLLLTKQGTASNAR